MAAVALSSLRVSAALDASAYVSGMQAKIAADKAGEASSTTVGAAIGGIEGQTGKASRALTTLSQTFVPGAANAAKMESAINRLGRQMDLGNGTSQQHAVILDGIIRKYGTAPDVMRLAEKGQVQMAEIAANLNVRYAAQNELLDRQAAATQRLAAAQQAQISINGRLGVRSDFGGAGRGDDIAAYGAEMDRVRAKFDPLFRAQQNYRAGLEELRSALAVGAISQSVYTAELDRRKLAFAEQVRGLGMLSAAERSAAAAAEDAAQKTAAAAAKQRAQGIVSAQTVTPNREADIAAWGREIDATRARLLPLVAAQQQYRAALTDINTAARTGVITERERTTAISRTKEAFAQQVTTIHASAGAGDRASKSIGLAAHQMQNLGFQANDVATMLLSGASPFQILATQGGQVLQILQSGNGGITGSLRGVGSALLGLITPATLAVAGVAAIGIAAGVAYLKWREAREDIRLSLAGIGKASGATASDIEQISRATSKTAQLSISEAQGIVTALVRTGQVSKDVLPAASAIAKDLSRTLGVDLKQAADILATSLAEPGKGAETLNRALGALDQKTIEYVRRLDAQNDRTGAQNALIQALIPSLTKAKDITEGWASVWERLTNNISTFGTNVGKAIDKATRAPTIDEQLAQAQQALANQRTIVSAHEKNPSWFSNLDEQRKHVAETAKLVRDLEARVAAAADDAKRTADNSFQARVSGLRDSIVPEVRGLKELQGQSSQLKESLAKTGLSPEQFGQTGIALARVNNALKDYGENANAMSLAQRKIAETTKLNTDALNALTPAQKADIAARRAAIDLLGTNTTQAERDVQINNARKQALAEATKGIEDQSRASRNSVAITDASTEALRKGSVAAAEYARFRKQAEVDVREGRATDVEARTAELVRERIAQLREERQREIATIKQQTSAQNDVSSAVARGTVPIAQMSERVQQLTRLRELEQQRDQATGAEKVQLTQQLNDLRSAYEGQISAQAKAAAVEMLAGQDQTIQQLQRELALVGKTRAEREMSLAVLRAEIELRQRGIPLGSAEGQQYIERARQVAGLSTSLDRANEALRDMQDLQRFVGDGFKAFFEELLSGTGKLEDAFKALGKGFLSASLDAFLTGKGPLAGLAGLEAANKGDTGGVIGRLMGNELKSLSAYVAKGTKEGVQDALRAPPAANDNGTGGNPFAAMGLDGKQVAGGLAALAGLAGAYGNGLSAGSMGQAVGGGALSGAMAGLMIPGGGPITAVIGAAIGAGLGALGKQSASKQAREERERQAKEAYEQAKPDIATLQSFLSGQGIGATRKGIEDTLQKVIQAGTLARNAGDAAEMHRLQANALDYQVRTLKEYRDAFGGLMESMRSGLGPSSPFSQAQEAIKSLGEQLKGMVDDAAYAFGEGSAEIGVAKAAARDYALTVLNGARELTTVQTRLEEIQGTAAGLTKILTDLGMAAADAGAAVDKGVAAAIARLKASFEDDLTRKINDASGRGYINEARDLIKEVTSLRADAGRLGTDPALVERYFSAAAQKIVDGAQLAGDELQALVNAFPALSGVVHDFTASVDAATIAARRLAYQDRLFAATNDTSTLGGQLAAFERQAQRQREEEIKAGGQAMADLEAALLAERYNVIKAYNEQAAAAEKQRYEEAAGFLATFTRRIQEFVDGLRAGSSSPLSPEARLAAAQSQYASQLALAKTGDRDALNGITSYASDLLEAAKAYYASSGGYQTIFEQIAAQLSALPKQLSAEQLIVNAIDASKAAVVSATEAMRQAMVAAVNAGPTATASALSSYFAMLDTTMDGAISYQEMLSALGPMATRQEQEWARQIFNSIDADGNGQIDKLELIRARTAATEANTGNTKTAVDNTTYQAQLTAQNVAGLNALLNAVNATNTSQYVMMQGVHNLLYAHGDLLANIRWNLYYANTRAFGQGNSNPVPSYAAGGWVSGPGTGTSDSITARLSNGEFVMPAAQARLYGGVLEQMRAGNARVPVLPMPVAANDAAPSYRELLQAVQQLKAEVASLTTVTRQGAALVGTEVSKVRDSVEHGNELAADTNKTARRAKAAA